MPKSEDNPFSTRSEHLGEQEPQKMASNSDGVHLQKPVESPLVPFGSEIVGRKISIYRPERRNWATAVVLTFEPASGKHCLRIDGHETLYSLGACKFKWLGRPVANAAPNPSWAGSPQGAAAVGHKVRIFWPGMGRYYQGIIKSFDASSSKHRVDYCDGDSAEHDLQHEAVVWLDAATGPPSKPEGNPTGSRSMEHNHSQAPASASGPNSPKHESDNSLRPKRTTEPDLGADGSKKRMKRPPAAGRGVGSQDDSREQQQEQEECEEDVDMDDIDGTECLKVTVGARIALTTDGGVTYLRGKMSGYHPSDGRHRLRFDDTTQRLLNMRGKQFLWVAPRSQAAGYTPRLHAAMLHLGATNVLEHPLPAPSARKPQPLDAGEAARASSSGSGHAALPRGFDAPQPPALDAAAGRMLCLFWAAAGRWYPAQVLHWDSEASLLRVLYMDGEDEWVDVESEEIAWAHAGHTMQGAVGVCPDGKAPQGHAADGWRVSVWSDMSFHEGSVTHYSAATGLHAVEYDDGGEESVSLANEVVVWKAAPGPAAPAPAPAVAPSSLQGRSRRTTAGRGGRTAALASSRGSGGVQSKARARARSHRRASAAAGNSEDNDDEDEEDESGGSDDERDDTMDADSSDGDAEPDTRPHRRPAAASSPATRMKPTACFGSPFQPQLPQSPELGKKSSGAAAAAAAGPMLPVRALSLPPTPLQLTPAAALGFSFPVAKPGVQGSAAATWAAALLDIKRQLQNVAAGQGAAGMLPPLGTPLQRQQLLQAVAAAAAASASPQLCTPEASGPQLGQQPGEQQQQQQQQLLQPPMQLVTPDRPELCSGASANTPAAAARTASCALSQSSSGSLSARAMAAPGSSSLGLPGARTASLQSLAKAGSHGVVASQPVVPKPQPPPPPEVPLELLHARRSCLDVMLRRISKQEACLGFSTRAPAPAPRQAPAPLSLQQQQQELVRWGKGLQQGPPLAQGHAPVTTLPPAAAAEARAAPQDLNRQPVAEALPDGAPVLIAPATARKSVKSVRISSSSNLAALVQGGMAGGLPSPGPLSSAPSPAADDRGGLPALVGEAAGGVTGRAAAEAIAEAEAAAAAPCSKTVEAVAHAAVAGKGLDQQQQYGDAGSSHAGDGCTAGALAAEGRAEPCCSPFATGTGAAAHPPGAESDAQVAVAVRVSAADAAGVKGNGEAVRTDAAKAACC